MRMTDQPSSAAARRAAITRAIRNETGIDEAMIGRLVGAFYAAVRTDPLLGPIFAARVRDWEAHLRLMAAFWSSVALMSGRYHGHPMQKHRSLPVDARHFDRWLALFEAAAHAVCPPAAAAHFVAKARLIAESLARGVAAAGASPEEAERHRRGRDDGRGIEQGSPRGLTGSADAAAEGRGAQ